jgi:hypothetical protein
MVALADPMVTEVGPGRYDLIALGVDYLPHHWSWKGGSPTREIVGGAPKSFGNPTLTSRVEGRLDILIRGWDRTEWHLYEDETGAWQGELIAPRVRE